MRAKGDMAGVNVHVVDDLLRMRLRARLSRDFATADALKEEVDS